MDKDNTRGLDFEYAIDHMSSRMPLDSDGWLFRIKISNNNYSRSIEKIVVCFEAKKLTPVLKQVTLELGIMHNYEKRLNPGDTIFADAIYVIPKDTENNIYDLYIGDLVLAKDLSGFVKFAITVKAKDCPLVRKFFNLYLKPTASGVEPEIYSV